MRLHHQPPAQAVHLHLKLLRLLGGPPGFLLLAQKARVQRAELRHRRAQLLLRQLVLLLQLCHGSVAVPLLPSQLVRAARLVTQAKDLLLANAGVVAPLVDFDAERGELSRLRADLVQKTALLRRGRHAQAEVLARKAQKTLAKGRESSGVCLYKSCTSDAATVPEKPLVDSVPHRIRSEMHARVKRSGRPLAPQRRARHFTAFKKGCERVEALLPNSFATVWPLQPIGASLCAQHQR
eukprot:scaffold395_cov243-Pinguiococcus_pyrenoidosus.AAC.33